MADSQDKSESGPGVFVYFVAAIVWHGVTKNQHKITSRLSGIVREFQPARIVNPATTSQIVRHAQAKLPAPQALAPVATPNAESNPATSSELAKLERRRQELGATQMEVQRRGGNIGIEWALGEVKNQKSNGACTAFALSSAIETLLYARFQLDVKVDELRFWSSYLRPAMFYALSAAKNNPNALIGQVMSDSQNRIFSKGTQLRISVPKDGFDLIRMRDIPAALAARQPVLFATVYKDELISALPSVKNFIPAHRTTETMGHIMLLSGLRTNLKKPGDLWLQVRNSWGTQWGKNGIGHVDASHCIINDCDFFVLRKIDFSRIEPAPTQNLPNKALVATNREIGNHGQGIDDSEFAAEAIDADDSDSVSDPLGEDFY